MAQAHEPHPYLALFAAALVPQQALGPDHSKDPPPPHLLPLSNASAEARQVLELLLGADHDIRDNHNRAAGLNLELAETAIKLAMSHGDKAAALPEALKRVALAREELAKGDTGRACSALADAVQVVTRPA